MLSDQIIEFDGNWLTNENGWLIVGLINKYPKINIPKEDAINAILNLSILKKLLIKEDCEINMLIDEILTVITSCGAI